MLLSQSIHAIGIGLAHSGHLDHRYGPQMKKPPPTLVARAPAEESSNENQQQADERSADAVPHLELMRAAEQRLNEARLLIRFTPTAGVPPWIRGNPILGASRDIGDSGTHGGCVSDQVPGDSDGLTASFRCH